MESPKVTLQIEITSANVHRMLSLLRSEFPALDVTEKIELLEAAKRLLQCAEAGQFTGVISARHLRCRLDLSRNPLSPEAPLSMPVGPHAASRGAQVV